MKTSSSRLHGLALLAITALLLSSGANLRAAEAPMTHSVRDFGGQPHCYHHVDRESPRHARGYWASHDGLPVWITIG